MSNSLKMVPSPPWSGLDRPRPFAASVFGYLVGIWFSVFVGFSWMSLSREASEGKRTEQNPNAISKFLICEISNLRFTIFLCWIRFADPRPSTPGLLVNFRFLSYLYFYFYFYVILLLFAHFHFLVFGCEFHFTLLTFHWILLWHSVTLIVVSRD